MQPAARPETSHTPTSEPSTPVPPRAPPPTVAYTWHAVLLDNVARVKWTAMLLCLCFSVVVLGTTADFCSGDCSAWRYVWAITSAAVSAAFCLARVALFLRVPTFPPVGDLVFGVLLTVLWVVAAAINTEADGGIHKATGNGYYATWFALFAAVLFAGEALYHMHLTIVAGISKHTGKMSLSLFTILLLSLVVVGEASNLCDTACGDYVSYAVAAGTVGAAVSAAIMILLVVGLMLPSSPMSKVTGCFLVIWWAVAAGVNTNKHGAFPSTILANGYYATWGALVASIVFLASRLVPPFTVATLAQTHTGTNQPHADRERVPTGMRSQINQGFGA